MGYCRAGLKGGVTETGVVVFACQCIVSPCGRTSNRTVTQIRHPSKRNQNVCDNRLPVHCRRWRLPSCCHTGSHSIVTPKAIAPGLHMPSPNPPDTGGQCSLRASKSPLRLQSCGAATQWKTGREKIWKKRKFALIEDGEKMAEKYENRANFSFSLAFFGHVFQIFDPGEFSTSFPILFPFLVFGPFLVPAPHDCNTKGRGQEQKKKGLLPPPPMQCHSRSERRSRRWRSSWVAKVRSPSTQMPRIRVTSS